MATKQEKKEDNKINLAATPKTSTLKKALKAALLAASALAVLAALLVGIAFAYGRTYQDKVFPGVYAGQYHLGGMKSGEVKEFVERFNDRLSKEGITFLARQEESEARVNLSVVSADDKSVEIVRLLSEQMANKAMEEGRLNSSWYGVLAPLYIRLVNPSRLRVEMAVDDNLTDSLKSVLKQYEDQAENAKVAVQTVTPLIYEVIAEKTGKVFNYEAIAGRVRIQLQELSFTPIAIAAEEYVPNIEKSEVESIAGNLGQIFSYGDLELNYIDPATNLRRDWKIKTATFAKWLEARQADGGETIFGLKKEKALAYLEEIKKEVDRPAEEARFIVENGRVKEFGASRTGIGINVEKTYESLDTIFRERNYHPAEVTKAVSLTIDVTEPTVKVSDLNNLGITEVLGVGVSTFRDSHTNRIKNIANAVRRLNGVLIKPGEEFSTNRFAGPYTAASGFLPEMVIKGDRIIPEIGGGMCQIGTTLFRMAMNAGMPITQRQNHSLVVSYYADPVNRNPGTDATVYEPTVDFRFLNDTGNYILVQTEIDYKKQRLTFTLWGKSDGRKGWYSHPTVDRWIPAGAPREIPTASLRPGQRQCQNAFRGAVARFTYTRVTPQGEEIKREFVSRYRPLPSICMVGEPPPEVEDSGGETGANPLPDNGGEVPSVVDPGANTGEITVPREGMVTST